MHIVHVMAPGRFPTVTYDPGTWWDSLASKGVHSLHNFSLNYHWWRDLIGPAFIQRLLDPLSPLERQHKRTAWRANGFKVNKLVAAGKLALDALESPEAYASLTSYLTTLKPLARSLDVINLLQSEFSLSIQVGPQAKSIDYTDSRALTRWSAGPSLLSRTIEAALKKYPTDYDLVLFSVTSPEDLLTSLIAARCMKSRNPAAHISLVDHGYENFSLTPSMHKLKAVHTLDSVFDTIIVSKDERDDIVPALVAALEAGQTPQGYIDSSSLPALVQPRLPISQPYQPLPVFAPLPILWTRASKRRCYWSRCTFCSQNAKYDEPDAPSHNEMRTNLDRLEKYLEAGYHQFMFSDEAISPSGLRFLAEEITRREMKVAWACRSKLEKAHSTELFQKLAHSGCFEILYGVETVSPRVLSLMEKVTEGMDEARIRDIFRSMAEASIGIHLTLIAAFPGETLDELRQTIDFASDTLSVFPNATFALNEFSLLPDAPIAQNPKAFGIGRVGVLGDIPAPLSFQMTTEMAEERKHLAEALPKLREQLDDALGWSRLGSKPAANLARTLYFFFGHGALFKARADNPFANPLTWRSDAASVSAA